MLIMFFVLLSILSIFSTTVVYCALISAARSERAHEGHHGPRTSLEWTVA